MKYLGMKFMGHDSSVCLIDTQNKKIFAISTERVTRIKHDWINISPILKEYRDKFKDVDFISHSFQFMESPFFVLKDMLEELWRKIDNPKYIKDCTPTKERHNKFYKLIFANPIFAIKHMFLTAFLLLNRICNKINLKCFISTKRYILNIFQRLDITPSNKEVLFVDHHVAHAASLYPWFEHSDVSKDKLILTMDGEGDGYFSKLFIFDSKKNTFKNIASSESRTVRVDHKRYAGSIGILYGNFTEALGLRRDSDEGKVEALAAFGEADDSILEELMSIFEIKDLALNLNTTKAKKFYDMNFLSELRKKLGDENFSATIQTWLENIMIKYLREIKLKYPQFKFLYLAGGVSANVIMNMRVYEELGFERVVVVPAMGDDGTALGSAIYHALKNGEDLSWMQKVVMPYFGHQISEKELKQALKVFEPQIYYSKLGNDWHKDVAKEIYQGKIVALVNSKAEFGPRALGNRSILANPQNPNLKEKINKEIKRRPWYQPFCPSVLSEERERLFKKSFDHKHMAIAFRVKDEYTNLIPSAVHIDGTARPQFVSFNDNPDYYKILQEFKALSGIGVLINTSFNLHGRAMVRTAKDAVVDFLDCNIDSLYIHGYKITRK